MKWKINNQKCLKCGGCVSVCPTGALDLQDHVLYNEKLCILCGDCQEACPIEAIEVGTS